MQMDRTAERAFVELKNQLELLGYSQVCAMGRVRVCLALARVRARAPLLTPRVTWRATQPLGLESAPLVRRLLDDYVTAADNLEAMRTDAANSANGNAASRAKMIPLQADVAKLQRENDRVRICARVGACVALAHARTRDISCTWSSFSARSCWTSCSASRRGASSGCATTSRTSCSLSTSAMRRAWRR